MKIKVTDFGVKKYYYPCDLQKKSTPELVSILRWLRMEESTEKKNPWNKGVDLEGAWLEFSWEEDGTRYISQYSMIWMVKKVLAEREHILKSKGERKKIRLEKSKNRDEVLIRIKIK